MQLCKLSRKMSCDFFTLIHVKWALLIWQMAIKRDWNGFHSCVRRLCGRGLREHSLISKYACAHIRSAWAVRLMYGAWTGECWAETWCWVNANIPWRPQSFKTTSHVNCYLLYWSILFLSFLDLSLTNIFFLFFHILSFLLNIFSNIILSHLVSHILFLSHLISYLSLILSHFASHMLISHNLVSFCLFSHILVSHNTIAYMRSFVSHNLFFLVSFLLISSVLFLLCLSNTYFCLTWFSLFLSCFFSHTLSSFLILFCLLSSHILSSLIVSPLLSHAMLSFLT